MDNRTQLKRIFSYIHALVERSVDINLDYSDYSFNLDLSVLPEHEKLRLATPTDLAFGDGVTDTTAILSVGKPDVEMCPSIPSVLSGWLKDGWNDPLKNAEPIDKREFCSSPDAPIRTELFSDDLARRDAFTEWMKKRDVWVCDAEPAARVRRMYDKLYELFSLLDREKDRLELIIGNGMLRTVLDDGSKVRHPLVLERVSLDFDPEKPMFTVSDLDSPATLNTRLLRLVPGIETSSLAALSSELEESGIHAFDAELLDAFLSKMCNTLSPDCEFSVVPGSAKISVSRGLVLFVRSRNSGYIAMTEKILEDIDTAEEFSPSLLSILGEGTAPDMTVEQKDVGEKLIEVNGIDADFLLEKQANREQLLIARKINKNNAVLVQGPPGTGKTHTISNIIGDLLSRGKSVLVTSQTSKALSVLRDKISEPIRPLCVDGNDESKKQLEASLNAINDYMSSDNPETLDEQAERLEKERRGIIADLINARAGLVKLVEREYDDIEAEGKVYTPKEAATLIGEMSETAFIDDVVGLATPMPLDMQELTELYATNTALTPNDEQILSLGAPDSSLLLSPVRFASLCRTAQYTEDTVTTDGVGYWQRSEERDAAQVEKLCDMLKIERDNISKAQPWQLSLAQAGIAQGGLAGVFASLDEQIPRLNDMYASMRMDIIDTEPTIPDDLIAPEITPIFDDMLEAIEGEKINWLKIALHPKWKPVLERCVINGEKPDTRHEVEILAKYHNYLLGQRSLLNRWDKAIISVGGPAISAGRPEEMAQKAWPNITGWLTWYSDVWGRVENELVAQGFDYDRYYSNIPMEVRMQGEVAAVAHALSTDLIPYVEMEHSRGDRCDSIDELARRAKQLLPFEADFAPVISDLRTAIEANDIDGYKTAFDEYDKLCMKRGAYETRCRLIAKLSAVCPLWAQSIAAREDVNGSGTVPAGLEANWLRAQLRGELDARTRDSIEELQTKIASLSASLSAVTRDLISRRAWSAELRTMRDPDRKSALATWASLVKRVGKGTGKRAEQLLASGELRRAMKACRRSVPVWIMPLASVAEYFEPGDEKFDVLIIDEASQVDLSGLIALYIAKKVIVVGDDKQVSPTPVGLDIETSQKLRQEFLKDIKNSAMYDELISVYDLGKANYEPITLREHFRCATDIINFSNYYTYNGIICPLRDDGSITIKPAAVCYQVKDGKPTGKKTNLNEAKAVASLICACCEQKEYKGSTFGVVTMIGDEQGVLIDRLLHAHMSESEYRKRQILCGNPAYFQGDERDIIFISLVDAPKEKGGALQTRREGYNDMYAKRYNVAASRAKDQLWVVHSLDPNNDLKGDDIRLRLITHAANPADTAKALQKVSPSAVSEMEQEIADFLTEKGYKVTFREKAGLYTVSMLCSGGGKRVAVECDGDRPLNSDEISFEMSKQSVLERLGWKFIRVRASAYYRDKGTALEDIAQRIKNAGVTPGSDENAADGTALLEKIYARAEELRSEWDSEADAAKEAAEAIEAIEGSSTDAQDIAESIQNASEDTAE